MANDSNTFVRSLHDLGAAAWFGGALMGAVGLNGASADIRDARDRAKVAATGWARWAPVSAVAIGAHLVGGAGLVLANRGRIGRQQGAGANTGVKLALTLAAMGTTAYSGVLGAQVLSRGDDEPAESGTVPSSATPQDVAQRQQQLRLLQWTTPALVGVVIVLGAHQGEQQKAGNLVKGVAAKAVDRAQRLAA